MEKSYGTHRARRFDGGDDRGHGSEQEVAMSLSRQNRS
jgi:hypothetical protein